MKRDLGMTLIELLVVVVIIGIVAAYAIARIKTAANKSKKSAVVSYMTDEIRPGMGHYYIDHGAYPSGGLSLLGVSLIDPTVVLKAEGYTTNTFTEKTINLSVNALMLYVPTLSGDPKSYWIAWCFLTPTSDGLAMPCSQMTASSLRESAIMPPVP